MCEAANTRESRFAGPRRRVLSGCVGRPLTLSVTVHRAWPIALLCLIASFSAQAQLQLEFSISPSPVGSGARAAGMSDAFVAIADDATAASWNPAGLIQLERPEISAVGSLNLIQDRFEAFMEPGADVEELGTSLDLNFLSVTYPFMIPGLERNAVISLSYQQKFIFDRQFGIQLDRGFPDEGILSTLDFVFDQEGSFGTLTPALAVSITQNLSLGLAVNLWRDGLFEDKTWEQTVTQISETQIGTNPPRTIDLIQRETYRNLDGQNFSIGLLWSFLPRWNLGMRYDTAFEADLDFTFFATGSNLVEGTVEFDEDRTLHFPATFAVGLAFRVNDKLTLAVDLSTTDWDDFVIEDEAGVRTSLIDGSSGEDRSDFDRTWTVRAGVEYVFIPEVLGETLPRLWTLRGGLLFDQEPASGRSTFDLDDPGDGKPDLFYGASLGLGLQLFNRFNFDLAYQFRYGNNVNSDRIEGLLGFSEDVFQHRFLVSTVIYF